MRKIRADKEEDISGNPPRARRDGDPNRLRSNRRVFRVEDLPEETIEAIQNATMDPRHDHLNELIKDWQP